MVYFDLILKGIMLNKQIECWRKVMTRNIDLEFASGDYKIN